MHPESHRITRLGWLRAAVLGANDGLLSTSSLALGVAAAHRGATNTLIASLAGLVAGAVSMAAGEYVSVHSQADTEAADLAREQLELAADPAGELEELASIYRGRGLTPNLAREVAAQLMQHNPLQAHARDELGLSDDLTAQPVQAALASAASFAGGAAVPLLTTLLAPPAHLIPALIATSLLCLAILGGLAARVGGAGVLRGATRVVLWGILAMACTLSLGHLVGAGPH
ncbi:MAG: VIT family protein [Caulobacteraceae bacterium]|nr:VIT family protein [Caulobacter sp.]